MVQFCCVVGCGNRSNRDLKRFYRLPNISKKCVRTSYKADIILSRRKQWLLNIKRADLKNGDEAYSPGYIRVCSDHFHSGQPSVWSDVDNIDWAPTLKMGYTGVKEDKFFKNPNRLKKPRKDTEIKRAIRMQSLIEKRDLLPLISNLNRGTEVDEEKMETQPSKTANTKISNPKETNKKAKRRKKPAKLTKKKSKTTKSKQQPQRIERLVVPSSLEKPEEKLTENPIIHRITVDCIVLCPPSEVTMESEPELILPDRTCLIEEGSLQSESGLEIDETICTSDVKEGKFESQLGTKDSKRILDANDNVSDPDSKTTEPTWSPEISNFTSCSNVKDSTSVSDFSDVMSESNPETKNSTWVPEISEVSNESCAGLKVTSCLSDVGDKETEDLDKIMA